jgi:hypothetical protein
VQLREFVIEKALEDNRAKLARELDMAGWCSRSLQTAACICLMEMKLMSRVNLFTEADDRMASTQLRDASIAQKQEGKAGMPAALVRYFGGSQKSRSKFSSYKHDKPT